MIIGLRGSNNSLQKELSDIIQDKLSGCKVVSLDTNNRSDILSSIDMINKIIGESEELDILYCNYLKNLFRTIKRLSKSLNENVIVDNIKTDQEVKELKNIGGYIIDIYRPLEYRKPKLGIKGYVVNQDLIEKEDLDCLKRDYDMCSNKFTDNVSLFIKEDIEEVKENITACINYFTHITVENIKKGLIYF